jgi:hypothetical protein
MEIGLDAAPIPEEPHGPLFRLARAARGDGRNGSATRPMTRRAVMQRSVTDLQLDPDVSVDSLRVTVQTAARGRGSDSVDLADFAGLAGHAHLYPQSRPTPRSPAYVLRYGAGGRFGAVN